ncbi:hypothetical protein UCRPC4_g02739 [Phaeomoniella chlamydospora]|uniref:Uncharacterized protein n=1 Tax=Phaeomoniella chlamydospora TaxID=158046 RepID=A0A0G2EPA3_PHACM|nr:hypothetical protein UCRPC4_g02739 [Phaeomoniella chlamydospora]
MEDKNADLPCQIEHMKGENRDMHKQIEELHARLKEMQAKIQEQEDTLKKLQDSEKFYKNDALFYQQLYERSVAGQDSSAHTTPVPSPRVPAASPTRPTAAFSEIRTPSQEAGSPVSSFGILAPQNVAVELAGNPAANPESLAAKASRLVKGSLRINLDEPNASNAQQKQEVSKAKRKQRAGSNHTSPKPVPPMLVKKPDAAASTAREAMKCKDLSWTTSGQPEPKRRRLDTMATMDMLTNNKSTRQLAPQTPEKTVSHLDITTSSPSAFDSRANSPQASSTSSHPATPSRASRRQTQFWNNYVGDLRDASEEVLRANGITREEATAIQQRNNQEALVCMATERQSAQRGEMDTGYIFRESRRKSSDTTNAPRRQSAPVNRRKSNTTVRAATSSVSPGFKASASRKTAQPNTTEQLSPTPQLFDGLVQHSTNTIDDDEEALMTEFENAIANEEGDEEALLAEIDKALAAASDDEGANIVGTTSVAVPLGSFQQPQQDTQGSPELPPLDIDDGLDSLFGDDALTTPGNDDLDFFF